MNQLADDIVARIRAEGPLSIARYMELALGHPQLGYYMTRDPFGRGGDFITAPEISQMFGELIGLWMADAWAAIGGPARVIVAEAGPGRGTLMADALRAARALPAFHNAMELHLIETSPVLRAAQALRLEAIEITPNWHDSLGTLPIDAPILLIANEFLDALPIRQFVRRETGWHERLVGEREGRLAFGLAMAPELALTRPAADGAILEVSPAAIAFVADIASRLSRQGGAALIIDYGHTQSGLGDTLQAMKSHAFVHVLETPGEADLTAHVDFAAIGAAARQAGADVQGPVTQAAFLSALGLGVRAERLMAGTSPERAAVIAAERDRLTDMGPTGMGQLFKVMAVTPPGAPPPAGFA